MKVLHLLNAIRPSGMERMLVSASRYWDLFGIETLVVGQGEDHPYLDELTNSGYPFVAVPTLRKPSGILGLKKAVADYRPDVVNIHPEGAFLPAVAAIRLADRTVPIIRTIHSVFAPKGRASWSRHLQALLADPQVSYFVAPSDAVAANERHWNRESRIILNWVEDRYTEARTKPLSRHPRLAVIVGNCSPVKNHELALRACLDSNFDVAHIGNENGCSEHEKQLLTQLESCGSLTHRGPGDPLSSLRRASVFLLPSIVEGFSVALAEAISVNTPCIVGPASGLTWSYESGLIRVLSLELDEWTRTLRMGEFGSLHTPGEKQSMDLSAARGVHEYVSLYRSALGEGADKCA